MILATKNVDIPKCCYHKSDIVNKYKSTVAMYMALNGKIPDE